MAVAVTEELDELLTPEWLTAALGERFPGVEVTAVHHGPVVARVCTNARFSIECAGAMPPGLLPNLCAKGFFGDEMRGFRQAGAPEAFFYRHLAPFLGVRTLRSVYADVDPDTGHGVVITDDVVAQGATFLDAHHEYTPDQVAQSLEELAKLHIATWGAPAYAETPWLASRLERQMMVRGINEIRANFEGPIGAGVPNAVRDRPEALVDTYRTLAEETHTASPWCVVHGDPHINNLYLDAAGRPSIVDWQLVQRGPWYLDVGYHIASALTVDDRRRAEEDLVRHYLDQLAAAGIERPAAASIGPGIARGIVHGLFLWGITLRVDPDITTVMLERLSTAAADHDALGE